MGIRLVVDKKKRRTSKKDRAAKPFKEFCYGHLLASIYRSTNRDGEVSYRWTLNVTKDSGRERVVRHSLKTEDICLLPMLMTSVATWFLGRKDIEIGRRDELKACMEWSALVSQMLVEAPEGPKETCNLRSVL